MKAIFQYHHLGLCWPFIRTSWKFHNEKTSTHHGYMQKRHLDDLKPVQKKWNVLGICILFYMTLCFFGEIPSSVFLADIYFFRGARWRGFPMSGRNAGKQKT